jgi:hypothetical protein
MPFDSVFQVQRVFWRRLPYTVTYKAKRAFGSPRNRNNRRAIVLSGDEGDRAYAFMP